jgi:hypothetical protein
MTLAEHIADYIHRDPRLRAVPVAVIEDVLRLGIVRLAAIVPPECDASEIDAIEFEGCLGDCGNLIDPANPNGAAQDSEGEWICDACRVETEETAPPPRTPDPEEGR